MKKMMTVFAAALVIAFVVSATAAACASASASAPVVAPKGDTARLQTAMAKLRRGETVSVVALGGSITTGFAAQNPSAMGWAAQVADWWRARAEETGGAVDYHNAGVSGTDSAFAVARVPDHVLAYKPDAVFVEFAINDQWLDTKVRGRTYEGVLRQLLADSSRAVVPVVINERGGKTKSTRADEQPIADRYGLPTLAWADWQTSSVDQFYDGGESIHPNTAGHTDIARGIIAYLDGIWQHLPADDAIPPVDHSLPPPLVSAEFQTVQYLGWENAEVIDSKGWGEGSDIHGEWARAGGGEWPGWTTTRSDAELKVAVSGKSVGILFAESDQYRNGTAWLESPDGKTGPKVQINCFVSYRTGYLGWAYAEIGDNLGAGQYILHVTPAAGSQEGKKTNVVGIICSER
jgi:lysophospholipase L1-like esterase